MLQCNKLHGITMTLLEPSLVMIVIVEFNLEDNVIARTPASWPIML